MANYGYAGIKFPPLSEKEIQEKYSEFEDEMKEVLVWKIPDVYPGDSIKVLKGRIEMVKNKVDNLIKKLERRK